jgi:hypothetical protein
LSRLFSHSTKRCDSCTICPSPTYFFQLLPRLRRLVLVDRHQVVRLSPHSGKRLSRKPVRTLQTLQPLQPPVRPARTSHRLAPQFDELGVAHRFLPLLPRQNLVNLTRRVAANLGSASRCAGDRIRDRP